MKQNDITVLDDSKGGTDLLETLILVGLVAVAAIAGVTVFGGAVRDKFFGGAGGVDSQIVMSAPANPSFGSPASAAGPGGRFQDTFIEPGGVSAQQRARPVVVDGVDSGFVSSEIGGIPVVYRSGLIVARGYLPGAMGDDFVPVNDGYVLHDTTSNPPRARWVRNQSAAPPGLSSKARRESGESDPPSSKAVVQERPLPDGDRLVDDDGRTYVVVHTPGGDIRVYEDGHVEPAVNEAPDSEPGRSTCEVLGTCIIFGFSDEVPPAPVGTPLDEVDTSGHTCSGGSYCGDHDFGATQVHYDVGEGEVPGPDNMVGVSRGGVFYTPEEWAEMQAHDQAALGEILDIVAGPTTPYKPWAGLGALWKAAKNFWKAWRNEAYEEDSDRAPTAPDPACSGDADCNGNTDDDGDGAPDFLDPDTDVPQPWEVIGELVGYEPAPMIQPGGNANDWDGDGLPNYMDPEPNVPSTAGTVTTSTTGSSDGSPTPGPVAPTTSSDGSTSGQPGPVAAPTGTPGDDDGDGFPDSVDLNLETTGGATGGATGTTTTSATTTSSDGTNGTTTTGGGSGAGGGTPGSGTTGASTDSGGYDEAGVNTSGSTSTGGSTGTSSTTGSTSNSGTTSGTSSDGQNGSSSTGGGGTSEPENGCCP